MPPNHTWRRAEDIASEWRQYSSMRSGSTSWPDNVSNILAKLAVSSRIEAGAVAHRLHACDTEAA